jgi:hypothetical protein
MRRDAEYWIRNHAGRRDVELLFHREDGVGLANRPTVGETAAPSANPRRCPFTARAVDPRAQSCRSRLDSRGIILELAVRPDPRPGRHIRGHHALLDRSRYGRASSYVNSDIGANIVGR